MIISKKYHFYAGHRNENLDDKCSNLHGHTYYITMNFNFKNINKENGITMLFSNIDLLVDPFIKQLDHSLIINKNDPLLKYLNLFNKKERTDLKLSILDNVTSAENLAKYIFDVIKKNLPITKITLQETTTSIVIYEPSN